MNDFSISLVQSSLHWHDPAANRQMLAELLASALPESGLTDLIVLPEMFTTGFSMEAAQAEPADGPTLAWLREQAARYNAVLTGSVLLTEGGRYYNRLLWVRPDGTFSSYDKRHLFRLAGEHEVYTPGTCRLVEEWRGWRIMPLICYDLRFPVWSRNRQAAPYDLLLYVANWPQPRIEAWKALLQARAIENLAYTAGVNRLGTDGNGHDYPGQSALLDMRGDYLAQAGNRQTVLTRTLRAAPLQEFRQQLPALFDADDFELAGR
ncbi:amidohydrolase [Hymenobacter sp. HMF4947]|uniref:Omega-amidase YafV n=1 Tax=Hymenobacter ginkgonis TaxID=2682976 RepID=A0A7K1TCA7_9BACT|nr:amidohydrolase [Hymenobacter ginkgonis]MVN75962.1 amidohydrolase [Hymenobacter ginkgonis]